MRPGGAMEDGFDPATTEEGSDHGRIADAADDQLGSGRHGLPMPGHQAVEDGHLVPGADQAFDRDRADIAGAAGDQDAHQRPSSRARAMQPSIRPRAAPTQWWMP